MAPKKGMTVFALQRSLKARIALATLSIFLTSLWSLAFFASWALRNDMVRVMGDAQLSTVSYVADKINQELSERLQAMEKIAKSITPAMLAQPPLMQTLLEERPIFVDLFNGGIFVTGTDGTALADVPRSAGRIGTNYIDRASVSVPLKEGRSVVGQPAMGKKLMAPIFSIVVPIRGAQGQVIGAMVGTINLGLPSFLDPFIASRYGQTGGYRLVAAQSRLVIAATDKSQMMAPLPAPGLNSATDRFVHGYAGMAVFTTKEGVETLAAAKTIPVAGWYVNVSMPTAEAFAPLHDMQRRILLVTLCLTVLAGGLTWWMLRRQLAPLSAAVDALVRMAEKDQPGQILPVTHPDEIGQLISAFNHLLETLAQRTRLLGESERRFQSMADGAPVMIMCSGPDGLCDYVNQVWLDFTGTRLTQVIGNGWLASVHPQDTPRCLETFAAAFEARQNWVMEYRLRHFDGQYRWLLVHRIPRFDDQGGFLGYIGSGVDITERRLAEEKLQLAASVFSSAREGIMITRTDGTIIDVNQAFCHITGYARDDVLGRNPRILSSGRQDKDYYQTMWNSLTQQGHWYGEIWNRRKNGEVYAEMQTISTVRNAQGEPEQYVALFSDITSIKANQQQLEHIAHYDMLTGLPNRVLLADRLQQAIAQTQRRGGKLAVAYLDLDGFKAVNDIHGHDAGDMLLTTVATRMKQTLRKGDTIARIGGDEFVVVLRDLTEVGDSVPFLQRLLDSAAQLVRHGEHDLQVSVSVGVTFFPQVEAVDADQLLRQADQAMYQAKLSGRNRHHFFDAEQDRHMRGHHESLDLLRQALSLHEFVLYYQPKVNMRLGTVVGAEALIRWQHPTRGLLLPGAFLPVIEEDRLAVEVGEWVIHTALTDVARWHAAGLNIPVSVNVGARQLQQSDFFERLRLLLAAHPAFRPGDLVLEVLETSALQDLAQVSRVIESCRALGVTFSLDDFGTGYSSLTYLKKLAVTELKIDQSFVRDMLDDPDDLAILQGVIGLASAFGRKVVAEGVETVAHGTLLLQLGCHLAQGYGIARPMPADALAPWAATWQPDQAWFEQGPDACFPMGHDF